MRSREEIGREFAKLEPITSGPEKSDLQQQLRKEKLLLEVLCDIRELLMEEAAQRINLKPKKG